MRRNNDSIKAKSITEITKICQKSPHYSTVLRNALTFSSSQQNPFLISILENPTQWLSCRAKEYWFHQGKVYHRNYQNLSKISSLLNSSKECIDFFVYSAKSISNIHSWKSYTVAKLSCEGILILSRRSLPPKLPKFVENLLITQQILWMHWLFLLDSKIHF